MFHPGPMFAQVLLADEINRASPKTQSALLEADREEQQVTGRRRDPSAAAAILRDRHPKPDDQLGTSALPESQLDRFLMRITLGYPDRAAERTLLAGDDRRADVVASCPRCSARAELQASAAGGAGGARGGPLLNYLQELIAATRSGRLVRCRACHPAPAWRCARGQGAAR